jgi:RNA polymerase sigma-70 factor
MEENGRPRTLLALVRDELERPDATAAADEARVETALAQLVAAGRAAWPQLAVPTEVFIRRIAGHFPGDEDLLAWLSRARAADLYLATACTVGVEGAIATFDESFLNAVPAILQRSGLGALQADEIRQRVRERLFVGPAKIRDYSGRGALASWVEVVTLRIAIDMKRQERPTVSDDTDAVRAAGADPELELIKERYRSNFKAALRAALEGLSGEQRNLLKLHFVDGVTLDQLAALFRVHRATVARWIAAARHSIFDRVQDRLQTELALNREEFDSLLRDIRSRLDLSLSALLTSRS